MPKGHFEEVIHVRDIARSWEEKKGRKRKKKIFYGWFCTPGGLGKCVVPLKVGGNNCRNEPYKSNKPPPVGGGLITCAEWQNLEFFLFGRSYDLDLQL